MSFPASVGFYESDAEPLPSSRPVPSTANKYKQPEYPKGIPQLLRKGKATYAVGTGPLADDTDWTAISFAVLKEECAKRNMPASGTTMVLRESLTNYREPEPSDPVLDMSQVVGRGKSVSGEKRKRMWEEAPSRVYSDQLAKIKKESICLLEMSDVSGSHKFGGPAIEFRVTNDNVVGSTYRVQISKIPSCDCPAKQWRKDETCKHVFAILVDVLKVPEPLTWQKPFLPEELNEFFEPILSASEDRDVSTCRADHLAAGNCPVCFHEMTTIDKPTIECDDCHVKVHQRCFNVWAMHKEGYGSLECISCRIKWTQAGKWGTSGLKAEDEATLKAKADAKSAKAAEKVVAAEAKAAEKAGRDATRAAARAAKEAAKENKKRKRTGEADQFASVGDSD